jgi:hypothetical protein
VLIAHDLMGLEREIEEDVTQYMPSNDYTLTRTDTGS